MKILIAEDNRALVEGMAYCLRKGGHHVEVAADGEAALAHLRQGTVQLLVLDLGLPRVEGAEVLRAVREQGARLPVLVSSARDDAETRLAAHGLRGDAYLAKPFGIADFERVVAQLAWRFGLADREAASLPLAECERRLLALLSQGSNEWIAGADIARALRAGDAEVAPDEVERCIAQLRDTLAARTPVRLVKVRGLGYGLMPAH